VALASEVKAVLDSWVRYEQQVKESEQANLTKSVIEKVLASIKDEKTQREILVGAVSEIERKSTIPWVNPMPHPFSSELVRNKAI
jgi:F-type H+-transporting ATPase subunit b